MEGEQLDQVVTEMDERTPVVKVHFIGSDGSRSNAEGAPQDVERMFQAGGAITPPYSPTTLCLLFEHSNSLRQNVDAYAVNIDGFGHRFDPIIDLKADDADDKIRNELFVQRQIAIDDRGGGSAAADPTDEEVKAKKTELERAMRVEHTRLKVFFEFACLERSFPKLRRLTRQDLEVIGNAYWEAPRNTAGMMTRFVYLPGFTVRLLPLDPTLVTVEETFKTSELTFETRKIQRTFRRFVQVYETKTVYYKEFGDPRIVSAKTGKFYPSVEEMNKAEEGAVPATEIIHFKIDSARSPYGIPRWIGNLLSVIGSRHAEEVNVMYFENKSVPPLAILVSGGRLTADTAKRIEEFIQTEIKGKKNFHKVMVLEAMPANTAGGGDTGKAKIEIRPLTSAQHNDALFQGYDERNIDKVGMSFRLPRMLRGDIRDFNRSTADAAVEFAERQVFQPERHDFDFIINRFVFPAIGVRLHQFVSLAPITRDPQVMAEIIRNLANANVLTPNDGRELAEDVFNRQFRRIDEEWTKKPLQLTIAELGAGGGAGGDVPTDDDAKASEKLARQAKRLIELRDRLVDVEADAAETQFKRRKRAEDDDMILVQVPREDFEKLVELEKA